MFFQEKRQATVLRVLAALLGVYLGACAGTSAAEHSSALMQGLRPLAANPAPDSACQAVLNASEKLYTTPFHMYMTESMAAVENGKPMNSEMVFSGGTDYVLYQGKWTTSSTAERKELDQRNLKTAKMTCQYVRNEPVNGEGAALYSTHEITARGGKVDNQVWVSQSKGLILRMETDLGHGTHLSSRYEYSNVHAPKL